MGKRKRRLHSPKYAKKYASVRETYNRLRGIVEAAEADGVITVEEAKQIEAAKETVVEAIVETAVETVTEEVAEIIEKVEEIVKPVVKKVTKKKTIFKPRTTKRKKPTAKKET